MRRARQIEYCLTQCPHGEKPCNGTCEELKAFISIKRGERNG
nr:MAG TPA: zinc finger protein [Caudoviricetes sp.]